MSRCRVSVTPFAAVLYSLWFYFDRSGWFSAAVPAAAAHELGHCLALGLCGGRLRELRLECAGLCMDVTGIKGPGKEIFVLLGGPAVGLLWAWIAHRMGTEWGEKSAAAALILNGFNLLPALPLDGGRIAAALWKNHAVTAVLSGSIAAMLIIGAILLHIWALLLPAALIVTEGIRQGFPSACLPLFAPAGRSEPERRKGSWRSRFE